MNERKNKENPLGESMLTGYTGTEPFELSILHESFEEFEDLLDEEEVDDKD